MVSWQELGPNVPASGNWLTMKLGRLALRLMGWRIEGEFPNQAKMIVAVAPHSSNIDFALTVAVIWGLGLRTSYLAKQSLFRFPLGVLMAALGGIAVDRQSPQGLVEQLAERFNSQTQLVLGITPEGTRSNVKKWKSGFALIAQSANVPVLPAILNYETKVVRFHALLVNFSDAEGIVAAMQQAAATGVARQQA
ncbi:MAG: 1-acyl-sn-glycerol-3-phosphate acyltransferase [Gammaproteobacteria bacterium]|jgi:1-acyl-sn-glycerol-3-phosphate acyltransferase